VPLPKGVSSVTLVCTFASSLLLYFFYSLYAYTLLLFASLPPYSTGTSFLYSTFFLLPFSYSLTHSSSSHSRTPSSFLFRFTFYVVSQSRLERPKANRSHYRIRPRDLALRLQLFHSGSPPPTLSEQLLSPYFFSLLILLLNSPTCSHSLSISLTICFVKSIWN
jgi:hypothetical protein